MGQGSGNTHPCAHRERVRDERVGAVAAIGFHPSATQHLAWIGTDSAPTFRAAACGVSGATTPVADRSSIGLDHS